MATEQSAHRAVLQIRNLWLLAVGGATAEIGDWLYMVAPLVYVYAATESLPGSAQPLSARWSSWWPWPAPRPGRRTGRHPTPSAPGSWVGHGWRRRQPGDRQHATDLGITRAASGAVLGRIFGAIDGLRSPELCSARCSPLRPSARSACRWPAAVRRSHGSRRRCGLPPPPAAGPGCRRAGRRRRRPSRPSVRRAHPRWSSGRRARAAGRGGPRAERAINVVPQGDAADSFYVVVAGSLSASFVRGPGMQRTSSACWGWRRVRRDRLVEGQSALRLPERADDATGGRTGCCRRVPNAGAQPDRSASPAFLTSP